MVWVLVWFCWFEGGCGCVVWVEVMVVFVGLKVGMGTDVVPGVVLLV